MTAQRELVEGGARNGGSANGLCSNGWAERCARGHGKRCSCACGGQNHGRAHGADVAPTHDRHALWDVVAMDDESITIRDIGHTTNRSVTNDAEWVVEQMADELRGRRLFYYDSMRSLDELLVRDGRFAGFAPVAGGAR